MMEIIWIILAILLLIGIWIYWRKRKRTSNLGTPLQPFQKYPSSSTSITDNRDFNELKSQLKELVKSGWAKDETQWYSKFSINSSDLINEITPAQVIEKLLTHARRVTPEFSVPRMVPRTVVESTPFAAGRFEVDEEGWVTIKLSPDFFDDKLAAQAILAHEACHYILENSGIRYRDFLVNERYTDLCMFVCGFGEIFLAGYKRESAQNEYRPGHRLGYLTDAEYKMANRYVKELRDDFKRKLNSELDIKRTKLLQLVHGDEAALKRLIEYERRRNPNKSEVALYENAIDSIQRGR